MAIEIYSRNDLRELLASSERAGEVYSVIFDSEIKIGVYPLFDFTSKSATLATLAYARCHRDADTGGSGAPHTVCLAYSENYEGVKGFSIWCGDSFLEAGIDEPAAKARVQAMLKTLPAGTPAATKLELRAETSGLFGSMPKSGGCSFWGDWKRSRSLCVHTSAFIKKVLEDPRIFDSLESRYAEITCKEKKTYSSGGIASLARLAFKVPVLFEGDRGSGKTKEVRDFSRMNGFFFVEQGGHEGIEAPDLLGHVTPLPQGGYVWKDGPVTEAFRKAKSSKVVLLLDELLRIPQRELSLLLTALSPDNGVYRLRTGRVLRVTEEGVGEEESLECPVDNLCVVATTNVGAEYAVDEVDPAIAERFFVLRKDTTKEALGKILREVAAKKSFSGSAADHLLKFFEKMSKLQASGLCKWAPTTRTLVRALELSEQKSDLPEVLAEMSLLWVARASNGKPVVEQLTAVKDAISASF
jgi:MoxR-like ATPase